MTLSGTYQDEIGPGDRPPGWGRDGLTLFLEMAFRNRLATFANKAETKKLVVIDGAYMDVFGDSWVDPGGGILSAPFLIRCHAAWRSAVEHAMAGQVGEMFAPARLALEYAAYAYHIFTHRDLAEVFLRRHDDDVALQKCKSAFRGEKLERTIRQVDEDSADRFALLYQRAVDYGAHPNERAITSSLLMDNPAPAGPVVQQLQLHGDGLQLDHALRTAAQIGTTCLDLFALVFPDRFLNVGVTPRLAGLRAGL